MSEPPVDQVRDDADATPRPEEVVADAGRDDVRPPQEHPVAGGTDEGPPAQGEGAPDSY